MAYRFQETTPPDPATLIGIDQSDQDWLRDEDFADSPRGGPAGFVALLVIAGAVMFVGALIAGMPW
jgi:hypothetical protein